MHDAGILKIYSLQNIASSGMMPKEALVHEADAYYDVQQIGVTRAYAAMGAKQQLDLVVLAYNITIPVGAEYVILEDGLQYRISLKQPEGDNVRLTLVRLEELYDVYQEQTEDVL